MSLQPGSILKGPRATYKLHQALKANTVFKAQILDSHNLGSKWAVVKTSSNELERALLHRGFTNYQILEIGQSPYIRRLHKAIDLWHTRSEPFRGEGSQFPKLVSRSILEALDIFRKLGKAHTDINPNNILISGLEDNNLEVKVADLGMLVPEGPKLAHWLRQATIFGASDKIIEGLTEAWCIAKIHLLIGPMGEYNGSAEIEEEWDVAEQLKSMDVGPPIGKLIKVQSLRQELGRIVDPPISSSLIDFIEALLIIDPSKRPTAEEALRHPFLAP
ncbi:kinase-like domain-containing protein [Xylaria digitata]|nr:kinase-like domain-containing protein [Xylaria digitata]